MSSEEVYIEGVKPLELVEVYGAAADVLLWIDPRHRHCWFEAYSPGYGTPAIAWHRRNLTVAVKTRGGPVDGPAVVKWLRGPDGQALLSRVCDGHTVEWNGKSNVGTLSDDAQEALAELERWLSDAPALECGHDMED
jgi:hypothetical protein